MSIEEVPIGPGVMVTIERLVFSDGVLRGGTNTVSRDSEAFKVSRKRRMGVGMQTPRLRGCGDWLLCRLVDVQLHGKIELVRGSPAL